MYLNESPSTSAEKDIFNVPLVRWGLVFVGIAIGFLAMDILLRRPLLKELASVRRDLANVESRLQQVAGTKEVAWKTSHLLAALQAQARQLEAAKSAVEDLREFRTRVESEARSSADALAALSQIADLQQRIVRQSESVKAVDQVLAEIIKLHERLLAEKPAQEASVAALDRVTHLYQQVREAAQDAESASVELQKLADLRTKVLENSAGVEKAQRSAAELLALKDTVAKADDVTAAQSAANQLLTLRDSLRPSDDSTQQSQAHLQELLSLRDALAANLEDTEIAQRRWASVRKLESDMKLAGHDIAQAIETLELLTDLGAEFRDQAKSLAGLRQTLTEIALLETTVGRALRVLEPLAQLKNLTRLSDAEVRAAARAILEQRNAKLSRREESETASPADDVKRPYDDSFFFADDPPSVLNQRLVPMPRDLDVEPAPAAPTRRDPAE